MFLPLAASVSDTCRTTRGEQLRDHSGGMVLLVQLTVGAAGAEPPGRPSLPLTVLGGLSLRRDPPVAAPVPALAQVALLAAARECWELRVVLAVAPKASVTITCTPCNCSTALDFVCFTPRPLLFLWLLLLILGLPAELAFVLVWRTVACFFSSSVLRKKLRLAARSRFCLGGFWFSDGWQGV